MRALTIPYDALTRFRAAASEFARDTKSRASRLELVCDEIAALRAMGASFRTISELLGRCGIRASDTCVLRFCQNVLGETPTPARKTKHRVASQKTAVAAPKPARNANGQAPPPLAPAVSEAAQVALLDDLLNYQPPTDAKPTNRSGPRIARIKFASPGDL